LSVAGFNKRIYSFSIENKELVDVIDIDEEVTSLSSTVIFNILQYYKFIIIIILIIIMIII
jgi:hypothetical protein